MFQMSQAAGLHCVRETPKRKFESQDLQGRCKEQTT